MPGEKGPRSAVGLFVQSDMRAGSASALQKVIKILQLPVAGGV